MNSNEPVEVWNTAKLKCVNWTMVAAAGTAVAVSAAGWAGAVYLISYLLG